MQKDEIRDSMERRNRSRALEGEKYVFGLKKTVHSQKTSFNNNNNNNNNNKRMPTDRIRRKLFDYHPKGRRKRSRQFKRWRGQL
jgi:hypothetical protein